MINPIQNVKMPNFDYSASSKVNFKSAPDAFRRTDIFNEVLVLQKLNFWGTKSICEGNINDKPVHLNCDGAIVKGTVGNKAISLSYDHGIRTYTGTYGGVPLSLEIKKPFFKPHSIIGTIGGKQINLQFPGSPVDAVVKENADILTLLAGLRGWKLTNDGTKFLKPVASKQALINMQAQQAENEQMAMMAWASGMI